MSRTLTTVGFDADDTLWHNERFFRITQDRFAELLADFAPQDHLEERLLEAEKRNIGHYGFGIKGFVLSMIETAIEVTEERVPASVIAELMAAGRDMLSHPIELLPHVEEVVSMLAQSHRIILVTKGDLLDQERKLAQSGLGDLFDWVEIVSHKPPEVYRAAFARNGDGAARSMRVGKSMKSDGVPAIEAGSWGVYVPHGLVWELEKADPPTGAPGFRSVESLAELPALVQEIG
jgi:putative hydrolase of the HAD superfamily